MQMASNAPESERSRQVLEGVAQTLRPFPGRRQDMRLKENALGRYLREWHIYCAPSLVDGKTCA